MDFNVLLNYYHVTVLFLIIRETDLLGTFGLSLLLLARALSLSRLTDYFDN